MAVYAILGLLLAQHAVCHSSLLHHTAILERTHLEHKPQLGLATTQKVHKKVYEAHDEEHKDAGATEETHDHAPSDGDGGHEEVVENVIESMRSLGLDDEHDHHHSMHVPEIALKIIVPACMLFMLVYILAVQIERFEVEWMPESLLTICVGLFVGFIIRYYMGHRAYFSDTEVSSLTNATLLNLVLLPIIIFESGWSIRYGDFISQFPYILLFAILGTLISTGAVAGLVYGTGVLGLHRITCFRCCLCFASLISATDPVATLGTYSSMKVDPLLNIVVFGESVINDAVAIVLFNVFNSNDIMGDPEVTAAAPKSIGHTSEFVRLSHMFNRIIFVFFGSIFAGVLIGSCLTITLRFAKMREAPKLQVLFMLMSCYFTYSIAEGIGLSGIIATLFCAFLMGVYARPHMSPAGSLMATVFIKQIATMADTAVFVLVGIAAANVGWSGINFGCWCIPICLVSRALAVFPMGGVANHLKNRRGKAFNIPESGRHLFDLKTLFMMWHAGLRGGIALVLSMEIGEWANQLNGPGTKILLQSATFVVIVFFLAVFGGSTSWFLKKTGIPTGVEAAMDVLSRTEVSSENAERFYRIDRKFIQPILVGSDVEQNDASEFTNIEDVLLEAATGHRQTTAIASPRGEDSIAEKSQRVGTLLGPLPTYLGTPRGVTLLSASEKAAKIEEKMEEAEKEKPPPASTWSFFS